MPEGDSIARNAARLRPVLVGQEIVSVYGTAPSVRANSHRLVGQTVEAVRTMGKHLVIDASGGFSVHVHLGMPGRWSILPADRRVPGAARLVLSTASHHACCFSAPTVEVERTPAIDRRLSQLGPDVLDPHFQPRDFIERARTRSGRPIADVLLDQHVMAGLGNVYKSELLFLARVNPHTQVEHIADDELLEIADRAKQLMAVNVRSGQRVTTGETAPGREAWVYGRAGKPCRRCATAVAEGRLGDRVTYWCPACQPV
jgi:endonuclease-8